MKILKQNKSLFVKILISILLLFLCYAFSKEALLPKFCRDESQSILQMQNDPPKTSFEQLKKALFWGLCKEEQELLFWTICMDRDRNLPPNTELLVSSCESPYVTAIPGGEILFVQEGRTHKKYLLNLRTGEKRDIPDDPLFLNSGEFLSSELVWLEGDYSQPGSPGYDRPHYVLDLADNQRYELLNLRWLPRQEDFKMDPQYYTYFQKAEKVFIHRSKNILIALSHNFRQHPEENVFLSQYSISSGTNAKDGELLEQLMQELGVAYEVVDSYATSPTGKYSFHNDTIYISKTDTDFVPRDIKHQFGLHFISWYYDDSGVVVSGDSIEFEKYIYASPYLSVSAPILKLYPPTP